MGWSLEELQLAWQFRTASWEGGPARVQHMIKDSLDRLESGMMTPHYRIDDVVSESCDKAEAGEHLARSTGRGRQVWGSVSVPSYTTAPGPGHDLLRVLSWGVPIWSGEVEEVQFVAYIPCSLLNPKAAYQSAHSIIQFGHGLLGTREEALWEMRGRCEETTSVLWAIDWAGVQYHSFASFASGIPLFWHALGLFAEKRGRFRSLHTAYSLLPPPSSLLFLLALSPLLQRREPAFGMALHRQCPCLNCLHTPALPQLPQYATCVNTPLVSIGHSICVTTHSRRPTFPFSSRRLS
jgi:hypothetical protein